MKRFESLLTWVFLNTISRPASLPLCILMSQHTETIYHSKRQLFPPIIKTLISQLTYESGRIDSCTGVLNSSINWHASETTFWPALLSWMEKWMFCSIWIKKGYVYLDILDSAKIRHADTHTYMCTLGIFILASTGACLQKYVGFFVCLFIFYCLLHLNHPNPPHRE